MRDSDSAPELIFTQDPVGEVRRLLERRSARRVLVLAHPSRRFVEEIAPALDRVDYEVSAEARVHVPAAAVETAWQTVQRFRPDTLLAIGGGSAIGLGKAIRLREPGLRFLVVPTTYAGSEQTDLYGVRHGDEKRTGRDPAVRPDAVVYAPGLTASLPKRLTVQSLLNALAHPIAALCAEPSETAPREEALQTVCALLVAAERLVDAPLDEEARLDASHASARAGALLQRGPLGAHHKLAHGLGGRFDLEHAAVHSVLLPFTVRALADELPERFDELARAAAVPDLPGHLFDLLRRGCAPTSLLDLKVDVGELEAMLSAHPELPAALARDALHGGRPSLRVHHEDWGLALPVRLAGPPLHEARAVAIALHGRGSNANDFVQRLFEIGGDAPGLAIVAPQAHGNRWYPKRYGDALSAHGKALDAALEEVDHVVARTLGSADPARVYLVGFSQGACLACEYLARSERRLAGLIALSGARIGPGEEQPPPRRTLEGMPVLLGSSEHDPWMQSGDIERTAECFRRAGASVEVLDTPGDDHRLAGVQRIRAREVLLGSRRVLQSGYGNVLSSESLAGALPVAQNSPRHAPFGLYAEQVNPSGFVGPRHETRRGWLYRIRPSAQHCAFAPLPHPGLAAEFDGAPSDPNLLGWSPLPQPEAPTDFVDGLQTFGGAGTPRLRRGLAIHLYAANRSMEDRTFYDADGDLLLIPQHGRLTLMTELGVLEVAPGQIAILPRGLKFSVLLRDETARGWLGEAYGRAFHLPERGPIGANALADARHFLAPGAWHEDRLAPGYRVTKKYLGKLFEATQDHSPYDVVAWHGNYAPFVYDLDRFSPLANVHFDHADPSIFTVLSAPLDEHGVHTLDFVFFPPRWDATEGTFRPPFFHRNGVTEFNGIIRDPAGPESHFRAGCYYLTPALTAHGVRASIVERALAISDAQADAPQRHGASGSLWFQFETALPIGLSPQALEGANRIPGWRRVFGTYRTHYRPPIRGLREP